MRDLTRSMASFSWAMSLYGVRQMANLVAPRRAADAFSAVARSAEGALGPGLRSAFQTGDRLQKAVVDLSFGLVGLGPAPPDGAGASGVLGQAGNLAFEILQLGVDSVYWATGTAWNQQKGLSGWGPVAPPPGASDPK
jgi:hypothetical protein